MNREHDGVRAAAIRSGDNWWQHSVGYSLYVRSFFDSAGDGVGDLGGVIEKLDHLVELGVDVVWLSPFYPSPMADYGYDVADHCDVDPIYGTLEDFDHLLDQAHARGLRVLVDLVANHTSVEHPWFRSALADPASPYRDFFLWSDPSDDGSLPNNWTSYFGGPAWSLDPASGQYYLHLFLPEQPDLNWRNDEVRRAFRSILTFWLERGVDGFRIDVAQGMVKDARLRSNPQVLPIAPDASRIEEWKAFEHRYDILQPESRGIFREWKALCEPFGAILMGEVSVSEATAFASVLPGLGLDIGMWLETMHVEWGEASLRRVLSQPLEAVTDGERIAWQGSSLDETRAPSRFGGGEIGKRRALALATLLMFLPGVPFLYQGEELGLEEGAIDESERADPVGSDAESSRDGCRTPMPWAPGPQYGFSAAASTWLPDGGRRNGDTVAVQRAEPGSWLSRYQRLIAAWREVRPLEESQVAWLSTESSGLLGFRRGPITVLVNTADEPIELELERTVLFDSMDQGDGHDPVAADSKHRSLMADQAIVIGPKKGFRAKVDVAEHGSGPAGL